MPRSMANTAVTFGPFVTIPVRLYAATEDHGTSFNSFHVHDHDGSAHRITAPYICSDCGESVRGQTTRGVVRGDNVILVTDEELIELESDCGREFEILHFVDADSISPTFYDTPYHIEADVSRSSRAAETYTTLKLVLEKKRQVGIVRYAMRGRQHLAMLRPDGKALIIQNLRWTNDIRPADFPTLNQEVTVNPKAVKMMAELVDDMTESFAEQVYVDSYATAVAELIEAKEAGVPLPAREQAAAEAEVSDLLAALEATSAARAKAKSDHPSGTRRAPARRKAKTA